MTGMEEGVLEIPQTSPTRYISGIVALNIPSERGTGDWHETSIFFTSRVRMPRSFIIERGQPFDPSDFLGSVGRYDAAAALDSMGVKHPEGPVYAASHARAIADLVIASVLRGEMLPPMGRNTKRHSPSGCRDILWIRTSSRAVSQTAYLTKHGPTAQL